MLTNGTKLLGTPILSLQASGPIGHVVKNIIDPDTLQIVAFEITGPLVSPDANILDVSVIREYSTYGMVIDSNDDLSTPDEIIKVAEIMKLNFNLIGLKVETKKKSKIGKLIDYTVNSDDFKVQQIIVKRPLVKSFADPELTISRQEIVEITDYKVIIKDELKTLKKKASEAEFVPNFVNPFREGYPGFVSSDTEEPNQ